MAAVEPGSLAPAGTHVNAGRSQQGWTRPLLDRYDGHLPHVPRFAKPARALWLPRFVEGAGGDHGGERAES